MIRTPRSLRSLDRFGKFARELTADPNAPNVTDAFQEWWSSTFSPTGHL